MSAFLFVEEGGIKVDLYNFTDCISPHILLRGNQYFLEDKVANLEKTTNGYHAIVRGTILYKVEINLSKDDDIVGFSCNCPDEWNRPCKHVTACLFAIANERHIPAFVNDEDNDDFAIDTEDLVDLDGLSWEDLLESTSDEELIRALTVVAKSDAKLQENIANVIRMNRRADSHWMRLIDRMENELDMYDPEWEDGSDELYDLFDQLSECVPHIKIPMEYLEMTRRFIETTDCHVDFYSNPDFLFELTREFFGPWSGLWARCFQHATFDQKQDFVREFWDEYESDPMSMLEFWEGHWFELLGGMCDDVEIGQSILDRYRKISMDLDRFIGEDNKKDWLFVSKSMFDYHRLSAGWDRSETKKWLDLRLEILELRLERLRIHDEDGELESMLRLIEEHGGRSPTEREEAFQIAALLKLERYDSLRDLIRRQFGRGNDANLDVYLSSFPDTKRTSAYEELLDEWMAGTDPYHLLRKRLIQESRKGRIIQAIETHPSWMDGLYDEVDVLDLPRLEKVFRSWIRQSMTYATDRKQYQKIAHSMARIGTRFPETTRSLMNELIETFPKRRAMIDELNRAIG